MAEKKFNPDEPQKFFKPVTIAGIKYTHFKMRNAGLKDLYEAEIEVSNLGGGVNTPLLFNGQLMVFQLVEVSNETDKFSGPFTMNMTTKWGVRNYWVMRSVQKELDNLGEAESSDSSPD